MAYYRCIGSTEPKTVDLTFTVEGTKADNITISDSTGTVVSNVIFGSAETSKEITLTIPESGGNYTFTSSVAKATDGSGSDYSKTVALSEDTTSVKVMPSGALYWYGNTCNENTGGWTDRGVTWVGSGYIKSATHTSSIDSTLHDYLYYTTSANANVISGFYTTNKVDLNGKSSLRVVGKYVLNSTGKGYYPQFNLYSSISATYYGSDVKVKEYNTHNVSSPYDLTYDTSEYNENYYISAFNGAYGANNEYGGTLDISAMWLE